MINAQLHSSELSSDLICARVGISRRQLYYLYKGHGGVMKYITQRRLGACYRALVNPSNKQRISTVAYAHGFTHHSTFYRQFQARYGFSPR